MSLQQFASEEDLLLFAKSFLRTQVVRFRKDITICLTGQRRSKGLTHAYFPALISCVAFADLLSGLYCGHLDSHGLAELDAYFGKFMPGRYSRLDLAILYNCFRHKVAHLSHPYAVYDTDSKRKDFSGERRRRIAWTVYASRRYPPIELISNSKPVPLERTKTPWTVTYDHRVKIGVRALASDIVKSIYGTTGYLAFLRSDPSARRHFTKCMNEFFPQQ